VSVPTNQPTPPLHEELPPQADVQVEAAVAQQAQAAGLQAAVAPTPAQWAAELSLVVSMHAWAEALSSAAVSMHA
jgi:hypothetical protein